MPRSECVAHEAVQRRSSAAPPRQRWRWHAGSTLPSGPNKPVTRRHASGTSLATNAIRSNFCAVIGFPSWRAKLHDAEPATESRGRTLEGSRPRKQAMEKDTPILVYATFPSLDDAERIGGRLVDDGLAACVNILPGMVSIYVWQGQRQKDEECAMIIKSRAPLPIASSKPCAACTPTTRPRSSYWTLPVARRRCSIGS